MNSLLPHARTAADLSPCIVCGSRRWADCPSVTTVIRPVFGGGVVRCSSCGQGRVDVLPSDDALAEYYSSPAYLAGYRDAGECMVMDETAKPLIADRLATLKKYIPTCGVLLDIGASRGHFLHEARLRGWEVAGIEIGSDAIAYARERFGIEMLSGTLESVPLSRESFDCVHLSHVLEHLREPVESIRRLHGALRRRGLLVIEVPYEFGDLFTRVRSALIRRPPQPYAVPSPHLHFFTHATLCQLLRNHGFHIVQSSTPRRNAAIDSRILGGTLFKKAIYALECRWKMGPLIEVYAQKIDSA
jgi:SAM-dependent methyltransferase